MDDVAIDAIRALLSAKPRPVGWAERRERIGEVGSGRSGPAAELPRHAATNRGAETATMLRMSAGCPSRAPAQRPGITWCRSVRGNVPSHVS